MIGDLSVADVLQGETRPTVVKAVETQTTDFEETEVVTGRYVDAMVQPADPKRLETLDGVDFALEYITAHALQPIRAGEFVEYEGREFKVITRSPWDAYGYSEVIGESTNTAPQPVDQWEGEQ